MLVNKGKNWGNISFFIFKTFKRWNLWFKQTTVKLKYIYQQFSAKSFKIEFPLTRFWSTNLISLNLNELLQLEEC